MPPIFSGLEQKLLNELSSGKQHDVSREKLNESFHQGLLFLNALLQSIDERRLRS
jgi:hypothetical protein